MRVVTENVAKVVQLAIIMEKLFMIGAGMEALKGRTSSKGLGYERNRAETCSDRIEHIARTHKVGQIQNSYGYQIASQIANNDRATNNQ